MNLIFYRCVFRSRKENAIVFQNWIFDEVIPAIRKTGYYIKKITKEEMRLKVFLDLQSEVDRQSCVIKKQGHRISYLMSKLESEKEAKREQLSIPSDTIDNDVVRWLSESGYSGEYKLSDLHRQYHAHCDNNNTDYYSVRRLGNILRKNGYASVHKRNGTWFII